MYKRWYQNRQKNEILKASLPIAVDCFFRAAECTWWEWSAGSSLFFWRWPRSHSHWAWDGQPHYQTGQLSRFHRKQDPPKCDEDPVKMKGKLDKIQRRNYIEWGVVLSLTHMFYVLKGLHDIMMVYNSMSCRLNAVLWAPHFGLPIVQHTLRSLMPGYYQCDMDVGEMFLNFWLNPPL